MPSVDHKETARRHVSFYYILYIIYVYMTYIYIFIIMSFAKGIGTFERTLLLPRSQNHVVPLTIGLKLMAFAQGNHTPWGVVSGSSGVSSNFRDRCYYLPLPATSGPLQRSCRALGRCKFCFQGHTAPLQRYVWQPRLVVEFRHTMRCINCINIEIQTTVRI